MDSNNLNSLKHQSRASCQSVIQSKLNVLYNPIRSELGDMTPGVEWCERDLQITKSQEEDTLGF